MTESNLKEAAAFAQAWNDCKEYGAFGIAVVMFREGIKFCNAQDTQAIAGKVQEKLYAMNEQDKQAFEKVVCCFPPSLHSELEDMWKSALEYARGKQEPVAWMYPDDPYFDGNKWALGYGTTPSKTTAQWRASGKEITPLYTHPAPVVAVNEQLLEALKFAYVLLKDQGMDTALVKLKMETAICAAEAAKGA